jgi:hypothetical protein
MYLFSLYIRDFLTRGKNGFFEFNQVDFGVLHAPFMKDILGPQDSMWNRCAESLTETNR